MFDKGVESRRVTRIHVVSLPHTLLTRDYDWCAYTAKVRRFVGMVHDAGHEALVYGPDVYDETLKLQASAYHVIVTEADRMEWFGAPEWPRDRVFDRWETDDVCWKTTSLRAAEIIRNTWQPGDIVGIIGGLCQNHVVRALADLNPLVCEWGIGYSGLIPGTHRVYESYAWMHHLAGFYHDDEARHFDAVIPNCFDPEDFTFSATPGDYLLYMGRPNPRKGLPIIAEIARHTSLRVLIAGQPGDPIPNTEYVGLVTGKVKADLLAGARALLTPTTYLEPFGGVAVEAMMSGTPVISTDYGAFTETVIPGLTGYRCRMLKEFLAATELCADLDRREVADTALSRYSIQTGSALYGEYLNRLSSLYGQGWYTATSDLDIAAIVNQHRAGHLDPTDPGAPWMNVLLPDPDSSSL